MHSTPVSLQVNCFKRQSAGSTAPVIGEGNTAQRQAPRRSFLECMMHSSTASNVDTHSGRNYGSGYGYSYGYGSGGGDGDGGGGGGGD